MESVEIFFKLKYKVLIQRKSHELLQKKRENQNPDRKVALSERSISK